MLKSNRLGDALSAEGDIISTITSSLGPINADFVRQFLAQVPKRFWVYSFVRDSRHSLAEFGNCCEFLWTIK